VFKNKSFFKIIFFTGLFLSVAGGIFEYCFIYSDYSVEHVSYKTPAGYNVDALLYIPRSSSPPPVLIPFCGVVSTKEMFHSYSVEMCRAGYAVFIPDLVKPPLKFFEKIDFFDYVLGGINYLDTRSDVDSSRIALMGHSWGGYIAHDYGIKLPCVKTVISYGMSIYYAPDLPPSILLASGIYDLLHPPWEMLSAIRESSGVAEQKTGEVTGDIKADTARKQVVSPLTDHSSEILDPLLIEETVKWMNQVFGFKREFMSVREHYRVMAAGIKNFGLFLSLFYLSFRLFTLFFKHKKTGKFPLFFSLFCFILLIVMKGLAGIIPYWSPPAALILLSVMLWTGFLYKQYFSKEVKDTKYIEEKYLYSLKFVLLYFYLIWFSVVLSLVILRLPYLFGCGWVLKAPLVIIFKFFTDGFFYFAKTEPFLGLPWTQSWIRFFMTLIPFILLETFMPGLIVGIFAYIFGLIFRKRKKETARKVNKKEIIIVTVLFVLAIVAWLNLVTRGININTELILGLAGLFLQYLLLPLIIFIIFYKIFSRFSWFPLINTQ